MDEELLFVSYFYMSSWERDTARWLASSAATPKKKKTPPLYLWDYDTHACYIKKKQKQKSLQNRSCSRKTLKDEQMTFAETMWTLFARGYLPQMPLTTKKASVLSTKPNSKVVKRTCAHALCIQPTYCHYVTCVRRHKKKLRHLRRSCTDHLICSPPPRCRAVGHTAPDMQRRTRISTDNSSPRCWYTNDVTLLCLFFPGLPSGIEITPKSVPWRVKWARFQKEHIIL